MSFIAAVTSKGQITIPKEIRKILDSRTVEIDVVEGEVRIRSVKSVAGALAQYGKGKRAESLGKVRDKVWGEVAHGQKT